MVDAALLVDHMATQAILPLPSHSRANLYDPPAPDDRQLAPIDRAVRCLDRALEAETGEDAPTPEALLNARMLLSRVAFWVDYIPDPAAIFALDGGVQVAWKAGDRHVRLYCSPVPSKSYIYVSCSAGGKTIGSDITSQVDVFTLADGLRLLHP